MVEVRWSLGAASQLEDVCDYLADHNPERARLFAREVLELVESIRSHPLAGRAVPEYERPHIRERILGNYRIIYRLINDHGVEIIRVLHGARLLPPLP